MYNIKHTAHSAAQRTQKPNTIEGDRMSMALLDTVRNIVMATMENEPITKIKE